MKLFYRGHEYEAHLAALQEQETEEIGKYRGATLTRKRFRVPHEEHGKVELTYRGAKYSHDL
ncbi:MAG TPA: DUF4278 domain-containing protein [Candidatus Obscuribacterales bacterium]